MSDEIQVISAAKLPANGQSQYIQGGNDAVMIPNYGTINMQVTQQMAAMPYFGGNFYIPPKVDREYYNIFVLGGEEFDRTYVKIPRNRSLNECMTKETMDKFAPMTEENRAQIKTMPSLFMAENSQYGKADESQKVIYGFVPDIKIYDNYVKAYYCGYKLDVPQWRLNELLEELQLVGDDKLNEMNRTHWAIKRCDLIQELLEAGVQIPVFSTGDSH
mgnify:FL=1